VGCHQPRQGDFTLSTTECRARPKDIREAKDEVIGGVKEININ
jgi:hypothetical protein